jgi:hypothetical protein
MRSEGEQPASVWPDYIWADYPRAVIRLVTIAHKSPPHLLFASVELLPGEIPPPDPIGPLIENFGDYRLTGSLIVQDVRAAISWYESATEGNLNVPTSQIPITTVPLGPEPEPGRLVVAREPPIIAKWHEGTRLHRMVPLAEPPYPVATFLTRAQNSPRWMTLRTWIADRVHCDLLAMDDCLGGMILLVPNPLIRRFSETPVRQADGGSHLLIQAIARCNQSLATVLVRFREERSDGISILSSARLDEDGRASFDCPGSLEQVQVEVECDVRGPLMITSPGYFIGGDIRIDMYAFVRQFMVALPARRKDEGLTTRAVTSMQPLQQSQQERQGQPAPSIRLSALKSLRMAKSGTDAPGAPWRRAEEEEHIFLDNRTAASMFLRGLVARARETVIFVDPYFDHRDLYEYALEVQWPSCIVTVLTGRGEPKWADRLPDWEGAVRRGEKLLEAVQTINDRLARASRRTIDVLVMGGPVRTYHDRFLVVDENVWHCGHSFNRIGSGEVSLVTSLRKPRAMMAMISADISQADTFSVSVRKLCESFESVTGGG